jgi:hypothetical protein
LFKVTVWKSVREIRMCDGYLFLVRRETTHSRIMAPISEVTR